jgi:hypothetical protein
MHRQPVQAGETTPAAPAARAWSEKGQRNLYEAAGAGGFNPRVLTFTLDSGAVERQEVRDDPCPWLIEVLPHSPLDRLRGGRADSSPQVGDADVEGGFEVG